MSNNYKFCQNKKCEYFPCHKGVHDKDFNCIFCYCPLYNTEDCGGNYKTLSNGIKDCSDCMIPHNGTAGYDYIIKKLKKELK